MNNTKAALTVVAIILAVSLLALIAINPNKERENRSTNVKSVVERVHGNGEKTTKVSGQITATIGE